MVTCNVRKTINFLFIVHSKGCSSEYLAIAMFVEEVDHLFDSFNGGTRVDPGKTLRCTLSHNSPHMVHWENASMGIKSWVFLKDGKPTFLLHHPSQNGWLIDITAAQHVCRTVKEAGFKCLHTQSLNQDPLENTSGAIRLYCGSNDSPTVGQFVDALKASIINGLTFTGLRGTNCEDDGATLLDNLQSLFRVPDAASRKPFTSHGKETPNDGPESFHVAQQVQKDIGSEVHAGNMEVFSVACVSVIIARQVLRGVSCEVLLPANVFINFKEHSDSEQSLSPIHLRSWWRLLVLL
jgi:hypothetical protein